MTTEKTGETLTAFKKQPTIKSFIEKKLHNSIKFLDLSIYLRKSVNSQYTENPLKQMS
jgi:hypothetical protein